MTPSHLRKRLDRQPQEASRFAGSGIVLKDSPSDEEIEAGEDAEDKFRDFCDKSDITYLYIDQQSYNKSSRLVDEKAARPDFLVMEPYKMPFSVSGGFPINQARLSPSTSASDSSGRAGVAGRF